MSEMTITGKITHVLPIQTFDSGFTKRTFVISYMDGNYEKNVAFDLLKDKAEKVSDADIGKEVELKYNIESREYNGKWYTNAVAWYVKLDSSSAATQSTEPSTATDEDSPF